jgi:hypothetical protein
LDVEKAPVRFKDAVGRKFSFPWHLCKTWKGMEGLIKQAFLHVDVIGQYVQEGHYDLMGPNGEIILPQVWETMIKPDWEVSMHMWPIPETHKKYKKPKPEDEVVMQYDQNGMPIIDDVFAGMSLNDSVRLGQATEVKSAKKEGKTRGGKVKSDKRNLIHAGIPLPPGLGPHLPPQVQSAQPFVNGEGPVMVNDGDEAHPNRTTKKKELSGFAAWMAGQPPKPSKKR